MVIPTPMYSAGVHVVSFLDLKKVYFRDNLDLLFNQVCVAPVNSRKTDAQACSWARVWYKDVDLAAGS